MNDYAQQITASLYAQFTISYEEAAAIVRRHAGLVMAGKHAGDSVTDLAHDLMLLDEEPLDQA